MHGKQGLGVLVASCKDFEYVAFTTYQRNFFLMNEFLKI